MKGGGRISENQWAVGNGHTSPPSIIAQLLYSHYLSRPWALSIYRISQQIGDTYVCIACTRTRVGQANYRSPPIRKFLGSFPHRKSAQFLMCASPHIANPQFFFINPQIANPLISTNCCTPLSPNSPKSPFFKRFFCYVQFQ
jgi:hypothetical protein